MLKNKVCERPFPGGKNQGFITNKNEFVNRKTAMKIAKKAKQIPEKYMDRTELFSEFIWDQQGCSLFFPTECDEM
jgi:hypothetical protein